ncbi:MAG: SdpI family protein [Phycisphaerae bacterium]|nr:SdpI family protein [Phycisphaerae bacterium]
MMLSRTQLITVLLLVAAGFAASAWYFPQLPEQVPTHWNWRGEVDQYGPKWINAWLLPAVAASLPLLMMGLPALGPMRRNFAEFRETYGRFVVLMTAMFVALHIVILLQTAGVKFGIGSAISVILGGAFVLMGNWFGKIRRNFYLGIRTPWTLANEQVWDRTHRVGGRLFMLSGLVAVIAGFTAPQWVAAIVLFSSLIGTAVWTLVYSYLIYRKLEPEDAQTTP